MIWLVLSLSATATALAGFSAGQAWVRRRWDDELDEAYDEGYQRCERDREAEERARAEHSYTDVPTELIPESSGDPQTDAWLDEISRDSGPETLTELERVAAISDHYAADPRHVHMVQAAEVVRWGVLVGDYVDGWQEEIMPAGDALYEQVMAEMSAQLERLGSR